MNIKFSTLSATSSALAITLSLLTSASIYADQYPVYSEEDSILSLPSIDLDGQPGYFQEAELELVDSNLWLWQLIDVKEGKLNQNIESVELIQTDSFPVQAFLKISGEFTHGCAAVGQTRHQPADGNVLIINSYYQNNAWTANPEVVLCTAVMQPFSFVYPLPVYGLPAGEYGYELNGEFSGSLILSEDNVYAPDSED